MAKKIIWQGKVSIETAEKLRNELVAAFDEDSSVFIDLSRVETIDTAGVQLLMSAMKEAIAKKGALTFEGHVPKDVSRKLVMGGFIDQMVSEGSQLSNFLTKIVS